MKTMTRLILSAYREKYRLQKEIDKKRLEAEAIQVEMTGLGHKGVEMLPEQMTSSKPMPHTVSPTYNDQKLLSLIEKKDELEHQVDYLVMSLSLANKVDAMSVADRELMRELYHSRKTADQVAEEHGYSRKGMYKRIYAEVDKLC
ncbi:hypothetical protein [Faecalibaculum rodentium]|uniref:hypothetical protein n=1 Tax=Faecalibaculum rodentium TaxID=1702221 RepID=UPI00272FF0DD|nr:hypothetical protein [Faecalibaculum rodentium]